MDNREYHTRTIEKFRDWLALERFQIVEIWANKFTVKNEHGALIRLRFDELRTLAHQCKDEQARREREVELVRMEDRRKREREKAQERLSEK